MSLFTKDPEKLDPIAKLFLEMKKTGETTPKDEKRKLRQMDNRRSASAKESEEDRYSKAYAESDRKKASEKVTKEETISESEWSFRRGGAGHSSEGEIHPVKPGPHMHDNLRSDPKDFDPDANDGRYSQTHTIFHMPTGKKFTIYSNRGELRIRPVGHNDKKLSYALVKHLEEETQLDEISYEKSERYQDKARKEYKDPFTLTHKKAQRKKGILLAYDKQKARARVPVTYKEDEQLDEIGDSAAGQKKLTKYLRKADNSSLQAAIDSFEPSKEKDANRVMSNRSTGMERAVARGGKKPIGWDPGPIEKKVYPKQSGKVLRFRVKNTNEETLDEISKKKVHDYIDKSENDQSVRQYLNPKGSKAHATWKRKFKNRNKGLGVAIDKVGGKAKVNATEETVNELHGKGMLEKIRDDYNRKAKSHMRTSVTAKGIHPGAQANEKKLAGRAMLSKKRAEADIKKRDCKEETVTEAGIGQTDTTKTPKSKMTGVPPAKKSEDSVTKLAGFISKQAKNKDFGFTKKK